MANLYAGKFYLDDMIERNDFIEEFILEWCDATRHPDKNGNIYSFELKHRYEWYSGLFDYFNDLTLKGTDIESFDLCIFDTEDIENPDLCIYNSTVLTAGINIEIL
jgi:hypothetical protein